MKKNKSLALWKSALKVFPGGVNSPVRAHRSVGTTPIFFRKGKGAYLYDEDGNKYLDFLNSWGPLIMGHSNLQVVRAIRKQAKRGTSFGAPTRIELEAGKFITQHLSFVEKVRFVNSGTEAVMTALRLARGFTGRNLIVKFEGCYHGHSDTMLVKAGSGLLTSSNNIAQASSPGVPEAAVKDTVLCMLDDDKGIESIFKSMGKDIAAVIIEPLPANAGLLVQRPEFIEKLRLLCTEHGALLILDEVISGFRLGFGGYAQKYKITPDLVTYGKIIGAGLPVGAIGGRKDILDTLAPEGPVYQAGTLSGNPLAMAAGLALLKQLKSGATYRHLKKLSDHLGNLFENQVMSALVGKDFYIHLVREDSLFWISFCEKKTDAVPKSVDKIWDKSALLYAQLFSEMLKAGIHMAPSAYEVGFLSSAMSVSDITYFIESLIQAIGKLSLTTGGNEPADRDISLPKIAVIVEND